MVQALEQTAREILTLLQGVHQGPGFQHSESRTAAPGQGRTAGARLCFSRFQSLPAPSAWVSRRLLGRGVRSWELSSQTSSKAAVQHNGALFCLFPHASVVLFCLGAVQCILFQVFTSGASEVLGP